MGESKASVSRDLDINKETISRYASKDYSESSKLDIDSIKKDIRLALLRNSREMLGVSSRVIGELSSRDLSQDSIRSSDLSSILRNLSVSAGIQLQRSEEIDGHQPTTAIALYIEQPTSMPQISPIEARNLASDRLTRTPPTSSSSSSSISSSSSSISSSSSPPD